jgi:hypothetical protein
MIMKKLLFVGIALAFVMMASGQIKFGVEAGVNLANLKQVPYNSQDATLKMLTNFNAGAFVSIPLMKGLTLQPEIMYSGAGAKYAESDGDSGTFHYNYLNIPVLLKYTTSIGIFAELGPQLGFLVSATNDDHTLSFSESIKSFFNQTDFSAVFGIGYISSYNLGIDLRYNLGFSNLIKDSGGGQYSLKNEVFQIDLFYLFSIPKKTK